jgi:hypothetical protein
MLTWNLSGLGNKRWRQSNVKITDKLEKIAEGYGTEFRVNSGSNR